MEKENEKSEEKEIIEEINEEILQEENEKKEKEIEEIDEKIKVENKEKKETVEETKTNPEKSSEESKSIDDKGKKSSKAIIFITLLIIFLLFISTIFALTNMNNDNIVKGVYIEEVDISNLTKEEVNNLINNKVSSIENIEVYYGEYNEIIKLEDLGYEINIKDAINKAISIGKSNNILIDNYSILKTMLFKTKFELDISINEEKYKEMIKNIQAEIPEGIKEYSYEIKDDELIITNGKAGKVINEQELKKKIEENIKNQFNGNNATINIPVEYAEPKKIDIEKIYNEIYKEAKDAYIVEGGNEEIIELHKEENGIDFKVTIDEAKQMVLEDQDIYTIPLKIKKPKVKVKDLGDKLFKQTLAKYTTIYDAGNYNRSHNIALAAKTINGTILLPGETFSYNGILGNTNKAKGYKVGTAYVGGKVVESYGGGICQVSSTLYNAALYANLEIVERYNHSYAVSYVPAGRDATVAYGGKNFRFKNTREYPIKIVASAKNGVVSISIKGIKEKKEYEVVLTSSVLSTTPNKTVYENNSSLEVGKEKVIQAGYIGKKSIAYKILKYNGKTISKTVLSKDTYKPMNRIVQVGTKPVATTPTIQTPNEPTTTVPDTSASTITQAPTTTQTVTTDTTNTNV